MSIGKPVWFDLMTSDVDAAIDFYSKVIGYSTQQWEGDTGDKPPYTMLVAEGHGPIGGVMLLPDEAKAMGAPNHWLAYVMVEDVDATAKKAEAMGGACLSAFDIPGVGRIGILRDPDGAVMGGYTPEGESPGTDAMVPGTVTWNELQCEDVDKAFGYYAELFGWKKTEVMDMGPRGPYQMWQPADGPRTLGGIFKRPEESPACYWLHYLFVGGDIEGTIEAIKSNGGQVFHGPMEVPGGDLVAHCMDPQGAAFAIHAWGPDSEQRG